MEALDHSILSEEVARFLEEEGLVTPVMNNKRKISTSSLSPHSSLPSRSLSTASCTDLEVSPESFTASFVSQEAENVEVPANLRSRETYAFLGFDEETATRLWERYISKPADMPASFFDFAFWRIDESTTPDASSASDDWDSCLRAHGTNDKLRTAILLPEFADLRYTASCKYWIIDAMKMGYEALEAMDERMRLEAASIQRAKSRPGHKSPSMASPRGRKTKTDWIPAPLDDSPSSHETNPPVDHFSQTGGPSVVPPSISLQTTNSETPTPIVATLSFSPSAIDRHTMIWRAGSRQKAENFYDRLTHNISLEAISTSPGDFSGTRHVAYWTPQRETADSYAQWSKHKMDISEFAIIQVAVPGNLINSLSTEHLWFGDHDKPTDQWKKLVWHGRKGLRLPKEIRYLEEKDLLIGHIAMSGIHREYEQMVDSTRIRESDVLTVKVNSEERKALQWIFNTYKATDGFEEHCSGKVWIHGVGCLMVAPEPTVLKED
ncbi:hypothetical protein MMC16_004972 [Acarospora aff. strigata]|nr:hypothetical protein [Acarospora aff. strigata]